MNKSNKPYNSSLKNRVEALFSTQPIDNPTSLPQTIKLESIILPTYQPRQYFDPNALNELAETIDKHGILEPLLVRPLGSNTYELIAGGRRYRAAQQVGLNEVPVVIKDLSDEEAAEVALVENLAREDLNPVEETEAILHLLSIKLNLDTEQVLSLLYRMRNELKGQVSRNVSASPEAETVKEVFTPLGLSWKSFIETRLPLLKLPKEILEALKTGQLAYTKAKMIAAVKDEVVRNKVLETAIAQQLSLSQIKEQIKQLHSSVSQENTPQKRIDSTIKRVKSSKIWKSDPDKWERLQYLLKEIDELIGEKSD